MRFLPAPITDLICCKPIPPLSLKWGGGSAGAQAGEPRVDYRDAAQKLRNCAAIPALSPRWNIEIRVLNLTKEKPRLLTKYTKGLHARNKETKQDK